MGILERLKQSALSLKKHIVLPEGSDERTALAAAEITAKNYAKVTVLGNKDAIAKVFKATGSDSSRIDIIDPTSSELLQSFADVYFEKRKTKGETPESAFATMQKPLFFGAMMVERGLADGCVAGAVNSSSDVLRAGLRVIGTKKGVKIVSSLMILETSNTQYGKDGTLFFADVAVNPTPDAAALCDIAIATADSWTHFIGTEPIIAALSFSTKGSAEDISIHKIREAVELVKTKRPDINIDGEMQVDAAIVPSVGKRKASGSAVAGYANVLIFPDLNSGNIGYKLVERFSKEAYATGPILQGLNKPMNDLSRGCKYEDIVNTALVTIFQSESEK